MLDPETGLGRFAAFNREVLANVDAEIDLGRYDNDGPDGLPNSGDDDGYVDFLFINLRSVPTDFFVGTATGGGMRLRAQGTSPTAGTATGGGLRVWTTQ